MSEMDNKLENLEKENDMLKSEKSEMNAKMRVTFMSYSRKQLFN